MSLRDRLCDFVANPGGTNSKRIRLERFSSGHLATLYFSQRVSAVLTKPEAEILADALDRFIAGDD